VPGSEYPYKAKVRERARGRRPFRAAAPFAPGVCFVRWYIFPDASDIEQRNAVSRATNLLTGRRGTGGAYENRIRFDVRLEQCTLVTRVLRAAGPRSGDFSKNAPLADVIRRFFSNFSVDVRIVAR